MWNRDVFFSLTEFLWVSFVGSHHLHTSPPFANHRHRLFLSTLLNSDIFGIFVSLSETLLVSFVFGKGKDMESKKERENGPTRARQGTQTPPLNNPPGPEPTREGGKGVKSPGQSVNTTKMAIFHQN